MGWALRKRPAFLPPLSARRSTVREARPVFWRLVVAPPIGPAYGPPPTAPLGGGDCVSPGACQPSVASIAPPERL